MKLPYQDTIVDIAPLRLIALFLGIVALRRIPALLVLYRWVPEIDGIKEALFFGHFGPMGVGAIFVSTLALTRLPIPEDPTHPQTQAELLAVVLQPIVAFVVMGSVLIRTSYCDSTTHVERWVVHSVLYPRSYCSFSNAYYVPYCRNTARLDVVGLAQPYST